MTRYLVPIVLTAWIVSLALGCDWTIAWIAGIAVAAVIQTCAIVRLYRDHHRRLR